MNSKTYPRTNDRQTVYLNTVIGNPMIEVGDYTIYNDFVNDPTQFEKNNVLYHYPVNGDRLVIGAYAAIATGLLILVLGLAFRDPMLALLGATDDTWQYASDFYTLIIVGSPFIIVSMTPSNLLRTEGHAVQSMIGSVAGTAVNIVLNPLFIHGFGWGAAGSAGATVIANICTDAYFVWFTLRHSSNLSIDPRTVIDRARRRLAVTAREVGSILAIGIPSLYFTYGYTGGPWPLAYKGLGEIFVILFFGLVAVLGTILVQIGTAPVVPGTLVESLAVYNAGIVTGIQCGLLCAVMISVNNIRDRKEDLTTGKRTLAVRLGEGKARAMAQSFILAAYITLPTSSRALHLNLSHTWWMWIPSILFGGYLMLLIRKTPADSRMNRVLALSSLHLLLYLATYTILPTR